MLLFIIIFTVRNFYKLLFTAETRVRFVTFLLFVTFINYFLLLKKARVYGVFIVQGGELKSVQVDFFPIHMICALHSQCAGLGAV